MKYLVTAPPGGLGHFLSRLLNQNYDFEVGNKGQYHDLEKTYSSQTTDLDSYQGLKITSEKVICIHNFDNRDFSSIVSDRVIINVIIDGCWEIYLNNWYRKAIQSNVTVEQNFLRQVNEKFPSSANALREEFYWLYLSAISDKIPWLHRVMHGVAFYFCDFYDLDAFRNAILNIDGSCSDDLTPIWNHFFQSQSGVTSRTILYEQICSDISNGKSPQIPRHFDNIDFGIMSGMIQHRYNQDVLNLGNDSWL